METIHLKTVDPISQQLLRSASKQGFEILWDRFEKLQPQDGFLRLGLSCPFGCLQGPCRIDPFGRGAQKGVCGMGQDEMVAGMFLRICLQGALEALASLPPGAKTPDIRFSSSLGKWSAESYQKMSRMICRWTTYSRVPACFNGHPLPIAHCCHRHCDSAF